MAAYNIPLEVKSPQIDDPGQVASRVVGIKDLIQRGQLQQIQAQEMQQQAQEKAMQLATQRALNQSIADNVTQGPDGSFTVNHEGVANSMARHGFGSAIPGYLGNIAKLQKEQADVTKDQLANKATLLEQTTQALQGVKDQAGYTQALPLVRQGAKALGMPPESVSDTWNPVWVGNAVAHGIKATDFAKAATEAAHLAQLKLQEAPKTVGEWRTQIGADLGNASSQPELDSKFSKWRAAGAPPEILNLYPNSYSKETQAQLQEQAIPPAQRQKALEEEISMAGRQLHAAGGTAAGYTRVFDSIKNPKVRAVFKDPTEWDSNSAADALTAARTPDQQDRSDERLQRDQDRAENQRNVNDIRRDLGQQAIDLRREAAANRAGGRGPALTPGQLKVEERNISALEDGTASRPGLNAQRLRVGALLKSGKDAKGAALDEDGKAQLQAQLQGLDDSLQKAQYRKAKLYDIQSPDPEDVAGADENSEIETPDGSVWTKKGGIAFFTRRGGGEPSTKPPAKPTAPAQQPPAQQTVPNPQPTAPELHMNGKTGQIAELVNGKWEIRQATKSGTGWLDPKTKQVLVPQ